MPTFAAPGARSTTSGRHAARRCCNIGGTGGDLRRPPSPFAWPGAERFDQVAYDHRGLGRSRAGDPQAQPTMADFAADALALVDHLGWQRFSLIGISFGGMVAQEIAIRAGERVRRLVLACTSSGGAGGASAPLHEILALAPALRAERLIELLDTRTREDPRCGPSCGALFAPLTARAARRPPGGWRWRASSRRAASTTRGRDWARSRAPTLVAAGRYDGLAPPENSRALAGAIAGARLEIFDGGHPFLLQDPAAWRVVGDFLLAGE